MNEDIMNEDNTRAHSVMRIVVGMIRIQESTGRGSKYTAREKAKRHNSTRDNISIFPGFFIYVVFP